MKRLTFSVVLLVGLAGCGDRPAEWDDRAKLPLQSAGLTGSVAVVDASLDRVLMFTASSDRSLSSTPLRVGKNIVATEVSRDQASFFVLSAGVQPRLNPDDERPTLTVIDAGTEPKVNARYTLTDPLRGIAIDPQGEWAVVYDAGGIVVNPNELIFVKLGDAGAEPVSKTLRSFGGRPERLTFTSELTLPNGAPRRFLIVETGQDVSLVDLADLARDEVTLILPKTATGATGKPLEVAFHDGAVDDPTDARIAVRLANDPNVMLVDLAAPAAGSDKPFKATINVAHVGGVPSSIAFVQTDGGLRLAALVPSIKGATLIDPATTSPETVDFPKPFSRITRVTDDVSDKPAKSDVALLWSDSATGIAFWSLGKTSGTPFRSVDDYDIGISVSNVRSVPGDKYSHLKVLQSTSAAEFYVLDLDKRQSFPMLTNASGFQLSVSPDGERAWALRPGTPDFASIDFANLHPTSIQIERDVSAVYDIARRDGGRAAIALNVNEKAGVVALGATVLDGLDPDTAKSKFFPGLLMGGLPK
ncbi:MAG: hypothetical protein IPI67_33645 [Myxococcales bacterium]|nr:hypothetical protein [Myxococcales bacterium]